MTQAAEVKVPQTVSAPVSHEQTTVVSDSDRQVEATRPKIQVKKNGQYLGTLLG